MERPGEKLKRVRERLTLTYRDVERARLDIGCRVRMRVEVGANAIGRGGGIRANVQFGDRKLTSRIGHLREG